MAMEMSDINTEHFGPCSGSFVVTVENPSNTTNESKIMTRFLETRFLENQMKSAHEQEYCNVFDDDDEEDNDEDEQANDDQANDDQFDDGIDAERIGATIEKLVDAFDSTFDEDDTLTISEGDPTFDDEDESDNKYTDGESYLSDEDDELNIRYDGDSGSVNEHEDEKIGNVFDKAFEKSGFKKDDFFYQTSAAVDSFYRRLTSLPIGSKSHSGRSKEDHIVMKSKGKKKKSAENKSRRSKKHESFLKRQFQKYKMKGDDEELTRKSTGTTATIDENTVGIKNSFSTESDESNLSNDMLVPDDIDDGTEYHAGCGGCLQTEEFVTLCNMTTAITSDDEALDEAFKGVCKDQFERIQRQPTVKAFHEKFIASKRLSRWVNRATSCGADGIPQGSSTNLEDGTDSIIDRMVESADSGNGAKATARDKEVINMDPNRTKEHSGTKRIERKNNAFAPVDSFAAKYSSIEMMSCMGGRENESGTTPGQEASPKSKSLGCEKPNDVDPTALQAEAKTLANAVLYMKAPIQKIALSVSSSKILYGVKNLLHKTAGKKSSVSNLETKAMFSPGISNATNKVQASDLEEESPILRVIVEDKSLSFPYDELGRLHGRPSSEIIPGDKPNDPVSPDDLLEHEEAMLSTVKEAIENVELVLSKSKYGLHKKETDILLSPLRKSLARAKMIISASALGACAGKEYEEVSLNLDTRFETFEVELVTEPTKTCSVEIIEGDAVELAKQNDEETLATESSLSIPPEYQEPELEIAEEEHKAITGSSSFSVHSTTKKIEKTKKVKKQSFWKARRSKMDEPSQTVTPPICSSILLKKDDVEVTTHSQEAIAVEKVKDNSSSKAEKKNKKPRWLSQRKKRKNGNLASVAHIQLSSSGNIHAVLPIVGTNSELESV